MIKHYPIIIIQYFYASFKNNLSIKFSNYKNNKQIKYICILQTGEDERHSCLELNVHGPTVRGWQSARRCGYPQELILRLHGPAKLTRIQVLAHQYLIRTSKKKNN